MNQAILYIAAVMIGLWGIAHLLATKGLSPASAILQLITGGLSRWSGLSKDGFLRSAI